MKAHPEIAQQLANAFVRTLKYINTHTPEDAAREWKVLSEFNPTFKSVKVEETYNNTFVDEALRHYR